MAFADYNQLTSITRKYVLPKVVDNISKDDSMLGRCLSKGKRLSGGSKITFPIRYRFNTQGGSYSGLETLDTAQENTRTRGELPWKQYHQPIVLSNIDIAKNGNGSVETIVRLVTEDMKEAGVDMRDKLATDLQLDGTKNGNKAITGLTAAVDDSTNVDSYAGITRSTYTWWKSDYTASVGSIALSDFSSAYDAAKSGGDSPSIIYTTETLWSAYEALLQAQVRFAGAVTLDGSSTDLLYRKTPIMSDEYCASGKVWFLNEKYLYMNTLKHPKYPTDKLGFSQSPLVVPDAQDGQLGFILWYGNLVNTQCRRHAVLVGATA